MNNHVFIWGSSADHLGDRSGNVNKKSVGDPSGDFWGHTKEGYKKIF